MPNINSDGLMRWGHFTSSKRSMDNDEPLYLNLFTITIDYASLPLPLQAGGQDDVNIVLEGVRSIGGLDTQPGVGTVGAQKYKHAERGFAGGAPTKTHLELDINFELNLRRDGNSNDNYTYKFLRKWCDLIYDPLTGHMSIKKNYVCDAFTITMQDKEGMPYHQWICHNVFPMTGMQAPALSYDTTDIWRNFPMKFWVDWYDESIL